MREIWIVSKREMKALLGNRRTLFSVVTFVLAWGFISVPRLISRLGGPGGFGNTVFYLATLLCVYVGFVLSGQSFLGEKKDSRIGTLLSTPLTVKKMLLGKVIGIVIPSFCLGTVISALVVVFFSFRLGAPFVPGFPFIVYVLILLPLFLTAFIGFLGFLQLLLGMRENRIVNIVIMIVLFGSLGLANSLSGDAGILNWTVIGILFGGVILLLLLLSYIIRFIRVERIITSLE